MDTADRQRIASDGQQLCLACGLCCAGVWFSHVNLEPGETEAASRAGLQLDLDSEKARSQQPCAAHQNGQCSAYHTWRPAACVSFRCQLLDNFVDGQLNFDQALAHVRSARAMADRIRAEVGTVKGGLCGARFLGSLDDDAAAANDEQPGFSSGTKLDAVALTMYYRKYFRVPDKDGNHQAASEIDRSAAEGPAAQPQD